MRSLPLRIPSRAARSAIKDASGPCLLFQAKSLLVSAVRNAAPRRDDAPRHDEPSALTRRAGAVTGTRPCRSVPMSETGKRLLAANEMRAIARGEAEPARTRLAPSSYALAQALYNPAPSSHPPKPGWFNCASSPREPRQNVIQSSSCRSAARPPANLPKSARL